LVGVNYLGRSENLIDAKQPDNINVETLIKSLGERVRQLRRDRGVSQEDFANACGFARSYMSRIERGTSNLSLDGRAPGDRVRDNGRGAFQGL